MEPIFFDIETVPQQGTLDKYIDIEMGKFKAPSKLSKEKAIQDINDNYSDSYNVYTEPLKDIGATKHLTKAAKKEVISFWVDHFAPFICAERGEKKWRDTGLDGSRGELISLSLKPMRGENRGFIRKLNEPESDLLFQLNDEIETITNLTPYFVGHCIAKFDLKFLYQRYVINEIKPSFIINFTGRHGIDFFDTEIAWAGHKGNISLDRLCQTLGLGGKGDIDGSKVWDYIKEGRYDEVLEYNKDDVMKVYDVFNRLNFSLL